ncbi:MAG: GNAT family N-acetyltransferase, partial [Clostridia bacterium]|nr:GNAT family N-acetyltransferase [Clostridia bacterium]
TIGPAVTDDDVRGKALVHYRAWHEAYAGTVPDSYLDKLTLEKCEEMAFRWRDNIIVAKDGDRVIGFAGFGDAREKDGVASDAGNGESGAGNVDHSLRTDALPLPDGELFALYVLPEYWGRGVGLALTDEAIRLLGTGRRVRLDVLADNPRAIRFYEKYGFRRSGKSRAVDLGAPLTAIEMVLEAR